MKAKYKHFVVIFFNSVNWVYVWWTRKNFQSSSGSVPVNMIGSLPETTDIADDEGSGEPFNDTNTMPPLSPLEIRQLTTTLGRLYTSCKFIQAAA